jgi:hypothetical protein
LVREVGECSFRRHEKAQARAAKQLPLLVRRVQLCGLHIFTFIDFVYNEL